MNDPVRVLATVEIEVLKNGSKLYRRHCLHCHGVTGNGRGPTAPWVSPHPRDYRRSLFKFTSTASGKPPLRADLYRTLMRGIDGTSMPPFQHLSSEELNQLVSYVIHLSIRGKVEYETLKALVESPEADVLEKMQSFSELTIEEWANPQKLPVPKYTKPEKLEEAVKRGYQLFTGDAGCISCHLNFGRSPKYLLDSWGTMVRPANLTLGKYRGGKRPIDLYYRVLGGVAPSGMPGAAENNKVWDPKDPGKVWDIVHFVRALPYPHMLPEDVRKEIYGQK